MNILIVNQSVVDLFASFFTLLTGVIEVDGTRMSSNSVYDHFVCRIWLTRLPLWNFLNTSTYSIFLTALERYTAVVHHVWYHNNVRTMLMMSLPTPTLGRTFQSVCLSVCPQHNSNMNDYKVI